MNALFHRNLSKRERALAIMVAAGGAVLLFSKLIVMPVLNARQQTDAVLTRLRAQYLTAVQVAKMVRAPDGVGRQAAGDTASRMSIAQFLQDIEKAAGSRVFIRRFQPLQSSLGRVRTGRESGSPDGVRSTQVQIDCVGTLADLMAFFERVEEEGVLTRIRHLQLTPEGSGDGRLHCQLLLVRVAMPSSGEPLNFQNKRTALR